MSDVLVTPRGVSRAAAAAAALASGFELADRARPYVEPVVTGVKRAYQSLRDYREVRYGPGSESRNRALAKKRAEREREQVKPKKLNFDEPETMSNSVMFTRSSTRVGRKRRRTAQQLFTASVAQMPEQIWRWQRVSPSLLGPGENDLAYGANGASTLQVCPFHIMSLTNNLLFPPSITFGCKRNGMHRIYYDEVARAFGYQNLIGQNNEGTFATNEWQLETGVPRLGTANIDPKGIFHKWTEIRFNLYGSAYYPLKYEILLVTAMPTEMSIFDYPAGIPAPIFQETNLNAFLREHVKDYIGNPIIGSTVDQQDYKSKFKIVRRKLVTVEPLSYGDAAAQVGPPAIAGVDASNVKNVNMFIRHDRYRDYDWTPLATDQTLQNRLDGIGFDQQNTNSTVNASGISDVDREERLYLIIKCSAPRLLDSNAYAVTGPTAPVTLLSPTQIPPFTGSYDVVVRNCYRYNQSV